ncbi:MAG: DUF456 family protein [Pseudomonadales bacterium]|nr:DUF456 family protein [Pseudomonadales bacterium]
MITSLLWITVALLMAIGLAGIILPGLPGTALIFAGILLAAWIDDFARIGVWALVVTGVLTVVSLVCDYLAAVLGAKRLGASRQAVAGALIGTLLGVFTGLWGLVFMPLLGAAIGEYLALRDVARAGQVGIATWLGLLIGTVVKLAIAFTMIGIFAAALWL